MNLFLTVFQVVAPVFILGAVGFAWVRLGFEYRVQFVTRLSMTLAVPCLIFVALMQTEIEAAALGKLLIASVVAYTGVSVAVFLVIKLNGLSIRTYLAPLIFGNTGNLGLPLALFAFGDAGLAYAVVVFAVMIIFAFTFGLWTVSGAGSPLVMLKEPLFGATVLGGVFLIWDLETPIWLTNALDLIGQMGIPLMLITLGVAVARLTPTGIYRAVALSLAKVVICTAIAWITGVWFGLDAVPFAVLVLQVATPVAVTSYLVAEKYGADAEAVAGLVVISTVISIGTIPLTLGFLI